MYEVTTMEGVRYRIGEIAKLAGVSKRTVDYYTNLGLLTPVRSKGNFRYYTPECLVRLKMIKALQEKRLTLEEIKNELNDLNNLRQYQGNQFGCHNGDAGIDMIRRQIRQLESQLNQLQLAAASNKQQAVQLKNNIMIQSLALVQYLMLYLNEIISTI